MEAFQAGAVQQVGLEQRVGHLQASAEGPAGQWGCCVLSPVEWLSYMM
jgi:hypothetical protein